MAHARLGEEEKARKVFEQAVRWTDRNKPHSEELRRFRAEAASLPGIRGPEPAGGKL
jgi:hypothetical protein